MADVMWTPCYEAKQAPHKLPLLFNIVTFYDNIQYQACSLGCGLMCPQSPWVENLIPNATVLGGGTLNRIASWRLPQEWTVQLSGVGSAVLEWVSEERMSSAHFPLSCHL